MNVVSSSRMKSEDSGNNGEPESALTPARRGQINTVGVQCNHFIMLAQRLATPFRNRFDLGWGWGW